MKKRRGVKGDGHTAGPDQERASKSLEQAAARIRNAYLAGRLYLTAYGKQCQ